MKKLGNGVWSVHAPKEMITAADLAEKIAEAIAEQSQEFDNLGDNESIILMGEMPTINLVMLAEFLLRSLE